MTRLLSWLRFHRASLAYKLGYTDGYYDALASLPPRPEPVARRARRVA